MAENKTKPSRASVQGYIAKIKDPGRRMDCERLVRMMRKVTGERPVMWATMIGFGKVHYRYPSGHEGDCFMVGLAARKPDLVLYVLDGSERQSKMLGKLGRHKRGKSCLYIRRLADVDVKVVERLVADSVRRMKRGAMPCS